LAHRIVHAQAPASPLALLATKAQAGSHAHEDGEPWIVALGHAACLHGDECAAIDQLLLAAVPIAATLMLFLLAAHHAQAALLALARSSTRPATAHARGPPR
jgi:hypothetical protein